jgi:hypothetical protein
VTPDDLDQPLQDEIGALLQPVEPTPYFRAKVLQRIDSHPVSRARGVSMPLGAGVVTIVVVTAVGMLWFRPESEPVPLLRTATPAFRAVTSPETPLPAITPDRGIDARSSTSRQTTRSATATVDVVISPDDAAAFHAFVSSVEDGRVTADMFVTPSDSWSAPIEPLRVEPLAAIPPLHEAEL